MLTRIDVVIYFTNISGIYIYVKNVNEETKFVRKYKIEL